MNPEPARAAAHIWGRGGNAEQPGAVIYVGRKNIFVAQDSLPELIARLEAINTQSK